MDTSDALAEEFNATAKAYVAQKVTLDLLTTKFSLLMHYAGTDAAQCARFVKTFCDCGLDFLSGLALNSKVAVHDSDVSSMQRQFTRLTAEDSIDHIPEGASRRLFEAGLQLLRRAQNEDLNTWTGNNLIKLAEQADAFAKKIEARQALRKQAPAKATHNGRLSL